ncbi:DUF1540 domain-containing protein [Geobacter sp.]|uniref:DUF1540 domain-containing protein n=1 Tax=Geobacter sp. TaxID=46610 RepID=UPI00262510BD|nr:DUF1540 domain-containing protein [Geobacter sp.]
MTKVMTTITECDVTDCAYNKHNSCHTLAITVGGPEACPSCDTYVVSRETGGIPDTRGGVGACKVASCMHNESLECSASRVTIGWHEGHADCKTFHSR